MNYKKIIGVIQIIIALLLLWSSFNSQVNLNYIDDPDGGTRGVLIDSTYELSKNISSFQFLVGLFFILQGLLNVFHKDR